MTDFAKFANLFPRVTFPVYGTSSVRQVFYIKVHLAMLLFMCCVFTVRIRVGKGENINYNDYVLDQTLEVVVTVIKRYCE